jgi:predicted N-acyltransferase
MADIQREEWDRLAAPYGTPLLSWGFLALLEASGSMTPETGWTGAHALARRDGELVAAAPFYVKAHSWGEFVFDFEFAEIAQRAKADWYPKLVGMIPATPAPACASPVPPTPPSSPFSSAANCPSRSASGWTTRPASSASCAST